jgi:hypothetical protein
MMLREFSQVSPHVFSRHGGKIMQLKRLVWATAAVLVATALTSCNIGKASEPTPDVNAIYTSAAQTMIAGLGAQQTQTAQAASPTPLTSPTPLASFTPLATFPIGTPFTFGTPFTLGTPAAGLTPLPTARPAGTGVYSFPVGCDDAMFVGETDPKDGTRMDSGKVFDKGWSMMNVGTCKWTKGYSFNFKSGDELHAQQTAVVIKNDSDSTASGHSQAFVVTMMAPFKPGEYKGYWQMKNASGVWFGSIVSVDIVVK